jgi:hypothetical protein
VKEGLRENDFLAPAGKIDYRSIIKGIPQASRSKTDVLFRERIMNTLDVVAIMGNFLMSIPEEVRGWVESFKKTVGKGSPTDIVYSLVQMGIDSPTSECDCDPEWITEEWVNAHNGNSVWRWLHKNHRDYNRVFWELISETPGLFTKLRRVLLADLKVNWSYREDDFCEDSVVESAGKIVSHKHARQLLDHFLWADKNKADWI